MNKFLLIFLIGACVMTKQVQPYGSWKSPITPQYIVEKAIGISSLVTDGQDLYWSELRPQEKGRYSIVNKNADLLNTNFNARTRVHEYGGGSYTVANGVVYFSNFADQKLYKLEKEQKPVALTSSDKMRYANATVDVEHQRLYCVREEHQGKDVINTLVCIDLNQPNDGLVIASGYDFYSTPTLSPDKKHLVYICWNHPNMPWDHTDLWMHEINDDGSLKKGKKIAGEKGESIFLPRFNREGVLHYVSDISGFWNLYKLEGGKEIALCPLEAEFGVPGWVFGLSTYDFYQDQIICTYMQNGIEHLALLKDGKLQEIPTSYKTFKEIHSNGESIFFVGGSPEKPTELVEYDPSSQKFSVLKRSKEVNPDPEYISMPEVLEFPGYKGNKTYALYYPPKNPNYEGSTGEKPPLIVKTHGGPTSHVTPSMNLEIQFWTSRGFAVVDVNYGGSSGYGRAYRERLKGMWGIVDVEDCSAVALYLADRGLVDSNRMAIKGGSAGGYTTLACLAFKDVFQAGASYYGVSDTAALATDTHKFESRYLDGLIGPYPERKDLYDARSPIKHTDKLSGAIILLQGDEDKIVPPDQSEKMFNVLKEKGLPTAYILFEKEQHGFRASENIIKAIESEYFFYSQIFGFEPADNIESIAIENLPAKELQ